MTAIGAKKAGYGKPVSGNAGYKDLQRGNLAGQAAQSREDSPPSITYTAPVAKSDLREAR